MSLEGWVSLIATVVTALAAIAVAVWLEFRKTSAAIVSTETATDTTSTKVVTRLDRIRAEGKMRCGVINHHPLSTWSHEAGGVRYGGYYVALALEVGWRENLDIEFVPMDWGVLPSSFSDLNLDLVLSIFETRARLHYADFVACMHKVGVSGVMRADAEPLRDVSQLSDPQLRIGVVVGEVGWEYVTHELDLPRTQLVQVDSGTLRTAFSPLISGDADISIVDDLTCAEFVKSHPGYRHVFAEDSLYVCKNSIMVPRGEIEFSEWVDDVFLEARRAPHLVELETAALKEAGGWVKKFR